jgi:hypothetical protein
MRSGRRVGFWLGIGTGVGAAIGVATHHLALGVALGAAWGVVMSFLSRKGGWPEADPRFPRRPVPRVILPSRPRRSRAAHAAVGACAGFIRENRLST